MSWMTQSKTDKEIMPKSTTENKPYPPHASLVLRGEGLDPQKITSLLKISPWRSGKRVIKDKKELYGYWILDSTNQVESLDPIMHIIWLLDQLEPSKASFIEISRDDRIDAEISCFWVMPSRNEIFSIPPELLIRIAALNMRFELTVVHNHD